VTNQSPQSTELSFDIEPDSRVVAYRGSTALDSYGLSLAAAAVEQRLPAEQGSEWGVYADTPFTQLAVLIAMQSLGVRVVLLPHGQPKFIEDIQSRFDGLVLPDESRIDKAVALPDIDTLISEGMGFGTLSCQWEQPVGLLTSGSSGKPSCSFKQPQQIIAEIEMLEAAFGTGIPRNRVFCGTTSHQHLFGFTFRVMWPFLTGRPLSDNQIKIPSEVKSAITTHGKIVLISSPAFLSRAQQLFDFDYLSEANLYAFSSGGPLDSTTATRFNDTPGITLMEIYGSTETGALASRLTSSAADGPWKTLPGVAVETVDGLLSARATHFPDALPIQTEDRAEVLVDGFILKGRKDKIVKVADKRVSLNELEHLLESRSDVSEARIVLLDSGVLGAVVCPSDAGWEQIRFNGKNLFCNSLRDHLSVSVERVTTPKRWRLVKRIERNTQGKVGSNSLMALFTPLKTTLEWEVEQTDSGSDRGSSSEEYTAWATIPTDLSEFDGHFPDAPIVPGVAQLSWVATSAGKAFDLTNSSLSISGNMERVKFKKPIFPNTRLKMALRWDKSTDKIHFELSDDVDVYSSGRLLLGRQAISD
jgi:3-hydroxymyristoyl/3-hydroxydecanoyl-(acyl carrier protein) dehydratase